MDWLSNWTNGNHVIVSADDSPYPNWNDWDANQRDLFILDHENTVVYHQNITSVSNFNQSLIANTVIDLINNIECIDGELNNDNPCNPMECYNGEWYEIIIDCEEQMGVPCEGGVYITPPEGVCCSTCAQYGDSNADGTLNILDVVVLVDYILNPNGSQLEVADLNLDGLINVLDVVALVNVILNP